MKFIRSDMDCPFKSTKGAEINYKNIPLLLQYVDYFGRIKKSYYKGISRKYQAKLSNAIKKARHMGLLAFTR
jgi:small subunit ribosomal protein S18